MQIFYTLMARQSLPLVPGATLPDDDLGPSILSATAAMTALATVAVCLRMYVRTRIVRSVGMDDYVMLSALVPQSELVVDGVGSVTDTLAGAVHRWVRHHYP